MLVIKREVLDMLNNTFYRNCKLSGISKKKICEVTEDDVKRVLEEYKIDGELTNKRLNKMFKKITVEPDTIENLVIPKIELYAY